MQAYTLKKKYSGGLKKEEEKTREIEFDLM